MEISYKEFLSYVKENINAYIPQIETAEIKSLDKLNGIKLDALIVKREGENFSPTIYLRPYFQQLLEKKDLSVVMKNIAETYLANIRNPFEEAVSQFGDWDFVKDKIVMTAVNAEMNAGLLENIPNTRKEDLAIIYKVVMSDNDRELATVTIRNEHMEQWNVTPEQIHECALENSREMLPATVEDLTEIMRSISGMSLVEAPEYEPSVPMYAITNNRRTSGAAVIFYSNVLEEISSRHESDLIVLPSSIHEVIVLPDNGEDVKAFAAMVREINETQVDKEEQLSDHVYRYEAKEHVLKIADISEAQLKEVEKQQEEQSVHHRNTVGSSPEERSPRL